MFDAKKSFFFHGTKCIFIFHHYCVKFHSKNIERGKKILTIDILNSNLRRVLFLSLKNVIPNDKVNKKSYQETHSL